MSYHDRILQLDSNFPEVEKLGPRVAYIVGHREGVEAAADIAAQADETIRCMTETMDKIGAMLGIEVKRDGLDVDRIGAQINWLQHYAETVECVHMTLDELGSPRACPRTGAIYSIVGRFKALAAGEAE